MPLLAVPANDIDTPGVSLDVDLPVAWLDRELGDMSATSELPGHLTARLSRSGTDIIVRGRVDAKLSLPCARCLSPALVDIRTELSLLLRQSSKPDASHGAGRGSAAVASRRAGSADRVSSSRAAPAAGTSVNGTGRGAIEGGRSGAGRKAGADGAAGGSSSKPSKSKRAKDTEYEFSSDEADVDTYDGETVVLDEFVREAILLELPNFPLCSEACPGIGPVPPASLADSSGSSDRIDPRLAPLGALREKLSKTAEATNPNPDQGSLARPASRASARPLLRSSSAATKTTKKKRSKE